MFRLAVSVVAQSEAVDCDAVEFYTCQRNFESSLGIPLALDADWHGFHFSRLSGANVSN